MKKLGLIVRIATATLLSVALAFSSAQTAGAAPLANVSLLMAQPEPSATNNDYAFLVSNQSSTALRCVSVQFNTQPDGGGFTPTGFDASSAVYSGSFMTSWAGWAASDSQGIAKVTRAGGVAPNTSSNAEIELSGITNGSVPNTSVYGIIKTFSDVGCTANVDSTIVNFQWTPDTSVSATIQPTLTFSVAPLNGGSCNGATITGTGSTSTAVSLGQVDKTTRAIGGQELSVADNAGGGTSVYAHVDGPLTDGSGHSIASIGATSDAPAPFVNPGTEAFGYTVDSQMSSGVPDRFTNGGPKWAAINTSDREVVYSPYVPATINGCIAYQITISPQTFGGFYGDNVTYTAVPSY
jgi:hypothetical protein